MIVTQHQCQECGSFENVQVHHKALKDDFSLIYLCGECHADKHPDVPRRLITWPKTLLFEKRFWSKVDKTASCWNWTGSWTGNSKNAHYKYGCIRINQKTYYAHRIAWELTKGSIPNGMEVLHHCDNPSCVRPDHLFLGNKFTNMQDKEKKKRGNHPFGENKGNNKLTSTQVREIKRQFRHYKWGMVTKLAREYGVSTNTMSHIRRDEDWQHIP